MNPPNSPIFSPQPPETGYAWVPGLLEGVAHKDAPWTATFATWSALCFMCAFSERRNPPVPCGPQLGSLKARSLPFTTAGSCPDSTKGGFRRCRAVSYRWVGIGVYTSLF